MAESDHGKGTEFLILCINIGTYDIRRLFDQPSFHTGKIPFGHIKCKKDPYEVLNIVSEPVNYLIGLCRSK